MKKFLAIIFVLAMVAPALAERDVICFNLHDEQEIAAGGSSTSRWVDIRSLDGYFSIQITLTGDGTGKLEYLLSNDGINYLEPSNASDITTGFTKTSGPGSDGKDIFSISPMVGHYMKIKATETGSSDTITVTTTLCYQ
jgi:hypothetical protein